MVSACLLDSLALHSEHLVLDSKYEDRNVVHLFG